MSSTLLLSSRKHVLDFFIKTLLVSLKVVTQFSCPTSINLDITPSKCNDYRSKLNEWNLSSLGAAAGVNHCTAEQWINKAKGPLLGQGSGQYTFHTSVKVKTKAKKNLILNKFVTSELWKLELLTWTSFHNCTFPNSIINPIQWDWLYLFITSSTYMYVCSKFETINAICYGLLLI